MSKKWTKCIGGKQNTIYEYRIACVAIFDVQYRYQFMLVIRVKDLYYEN